MKNIFSISLILFVFVSCGDSKKENNPVDKKEVAAVYETHEMEIEGMTCEIGCARTIESKLSKMDGIVYSKVDFESKKGIFTFDINTLNDNLIKEKIAGIAGGDLYLVVKSKKMDKIIK